MSQPEMIYLREGHVCGFTLPLPPNVMERWRAGHLQRVNEDGSTWQGDHFALPGAPTEALAGAADGEGPVRPKRSASRIAWAAYAVELGACTEEQAEKLSRDDLIELTTPPEEKPGDGQ